MYLLRENAIYSTKDLVEMLGVEPRRIGEYITQGLLPCRKVGKANLFLAVDILEFLDNVKVTDLQDRAKYGTRKAVEKTLDDTLTDTRVEVENATESKIDSNMKVIAGQESLIKSEEEKMLKAKARRRSNKYIKTLDSWEHGDVVGAMELEKDTLEVEYKDGYKLRFNSKGVVADV